MRTRITAGLVLLAAAVPAAAEPEIFIRPRPPLQRVRGDLAAEDEAAEKQGSPIERLPDRLPGVTDWYRPGQPKDRLTDSSSARPVPSADPLDPADGPPPYGPDMYAPVGPPQQGPWGYVEASVLAWRIKDAPLNSPILTTGDLTDPVPGAIGRPTTFPVFGPGGFDYGTATGFRFTLGGWLGSEPLGGELRYFFLQPQRLLAGFGSTDLGVPIAFFPFINGTTGLESTLVISGPGAGGGAAVLSETRLSGFEANGLLAAARGPNFQADLLAGVRVLNLDERLSIVNLFTVSAAAAGVSTSFQDLFETENRFIGGQVGARGTVWAGPVFASASARIAVGSTRSVVDARGASIQTAPAPLPTGAFPGGLFVQQSNTLRQSENNYSVVPELGLQVGCQVCGCVRAFVGYDCLYWTRVARPGDQIDRALNLTQNPTTVGAAVGATGVLVGDPRPAPLFNKTDFFAQGVSFGVEVRY